MIDPTQSASNTLPSYSAGWMQVIKIESKPGTAPTSIPTGAQKIDGDSYSSERNEFKNDKNLNSFNYTPYECILLITARLFDVPKWFSNQKKKDPI